MPRTIDVAMLPFEATEQRVADCFVVVDMLRATTTIATLFAGGLTDLLVVNDVARARAVAGSEGRLLFGEVGGLAPEGFDYGNSPAEAEAAPVAGRKAALFTTNGTAALCLLAGTGNVITGALANITAVVAEARRFEHVMVVCAGTGGGARIAQEDVAVAGAIVQAVLAAEPDRQPGDGARLATAAIGPRAERLEELVRHGFHGRYLDSLGLGRDVDFCLRRDTSGVAPRVVACGEGWALLEAGSAPD